MPKLRLTDIALQNLKPRVGLVDYWDAGLPTFGVRVSPKGTKTFVLKLQNTRRSIGRYQPGIFSLSDARTEAKRILAERTLGRIRPQSITFPAALDLFVEDKAKSKRPGTVAEYKRVLKSLSAERPQV